MSMESISSDSSCKLGYFKMNSLYIKIHFGFYGNIVYNVICLQLLQRGPSKTYRKVGITIRKRFWREKLESRQLYL